MLIEADCLYCHRRICDDCCSARMVSLGGRFPVLSGQGVPKSRDTQHQDSGSHNDDCLYLSEVCYNCSITNGITDARSRCIFLPIMVVTLPLPSQVVRYFPEVMVGFLQWFAFWSFSGLLIIPWLICVYQLVTHSVGRTKRIKHVLDEDSAPKVVIVMPCYKEIPEILLRTVDSLADCEYPPSCLHIFLSFDGDQEDELYLNTIERLGVPLTLDTYPKSIDVTYRSTRITVSRFPHGGKRHCQKATYMLIDKIYKQYLAESRLGILCRLELQSRLRPQVPQFDALGASVRGRIGGEVDRNAARAAGGEQVVDLGAVGQHEVQVHESPRGQSGG